MPEDRQPNDGYSVPDDGAVPSPYVPDAKPEKKEVNSDDSRYMSTNIMLFGAIASLVLFTYFGPIIPIAVIPVLYLMCRNVIKGKPNMLSMIIAGVVFAFALVYFIGFILTNI